MVARFIRSNPWPYSGHLYALIAGSAVILMGLTYQVSVVNSEPSHSTLALFLIKMTIAIPEIFIWLIAARSAKQFKNYAVSIKQEADGYNMNLIANGLLWLVGYLITLVLISPIQTLAAHTDYARLAVATTNHVPIIVALIATLYIFYGSRGLAHLTHSDFWNRRNMILLLVPFIILMSLFVVNFYTAAPQLRDIAGNFRFTLPVNALLLTYVTPHIIIWLLGLFSGFNLWWYARRVQGAIYSSLFTKAQRGLVLVFVSIFLAQLLICSPYAADNFQIGITLSYAVLILAIIGYRLLFQGGRQLQNIEDVV